MKMTPEEVAAVKQCMGYAGDDMTPDNALSMLMSHCKCLKKPEEVATLSAAVGEKDARITELSATVTARDTEIAGLKAKLPKAVDPDILTERAALKLERIELSANKGEIPGPVAKRLSDLVKSKDGKPNAFLLSRANDLDATPVDFVLNLFDGLTFKGSTEQTGIQVLSRAVPDGGAGGGGGGGIENDPQFKLLQKQVAAQNGTAAAK